MGDDSEIEWTDATWNPVRGCKKVSPGCLNCYAVDATARQERLGTPGYDGLVQLRANGKLDFTGEFRFVPKMLDVPLRWKRARTIFVNSMSDLFGEGVTNEQIAAVFGVMAACPQHTFQVLTKRAERMAEWFDWVVAQDRRLEGTPGRLHCCWEALRCEAAHHPRGDGGPLHTRYSADPDGPWPLPNVWLGVSVEDRKHGLARIEHLRRIPAAVRFLSIEPLLEDLGVIDVTGVHWVIVGGESGPDARPMHPDWVRSIREQCVAAGVPFFFKQWGGANKKRAGRELDGRTWDEMPERTQHIAPGAPSRQGDLFGGKV
jgi:protein gp37